MTHKITAVMPCFNRARKTRQAIANFLAITPSHEVELICVDDGSTDDTARVFDEFTGKIEIIRHEENIGAAHAVADGWHQAKGEILVRIDNDVILLRPDWWEAIYEATQRLDRLGIIGLPVAPIWEDRHRAKPIPGTPHYWRRVSHYPVNGGLFAMPRSVFVEVGYPWCHEYPYAWFDAEYTARVRATGLKTGYICGDDWATWLPILPSEERYEQFKRNCRDKSRKAFRRRIKDIKKGNRHIPYWKNDPARCSGTTQS